ncbi:hypothetical protein PBOI14_59360 [Pseudomonas sp. Boi14]|nr:hypothetical protein PBOI14_59360 [Pseudomonas sp. Boi14]
MSSPSAILWFAAVGGTLIARSGGGGIADSGLFLAGFFCAGLVWTLGLCLAATQGGKLLGTSCCAIPTWHLRRSSAISRCT